jgi:uncharacterized protein YegP (UPF0339 family)
MKYKICEYERGNGKKYWTISLSKFGLFWTTVKLKRLNGNVLYEKEHFNTKEDAVKQVEAMKTADAQRKVKRIKCEIV